MQVLGKAWAPHVVWKLSVGPQRFGELEKGIAGISAKVLAQRLRALQGAGAIVRRAGMTTRPSTVSYALTPLGRDLVPAIEAMIQAGARLKSTRPRLRIERNDLIKTQARRPEDDLRRLLPRMRLRATSSPIK